MKIKLQLCSVGNPDYYQDPEKPISPPETVEIDSIEEAPAICRAYIDQWDLGGGNWSGGQLSQDGKLVGKVSYNGKVWPPEKWYSGMEPIYTPSASKA